MSAVATCTKELRVLRGDDVVRAGDEWCAIQGARWVAAWPEDVGRTIAEVEARAEAKGEAGAYVWRGPR